MGMRIRYMDPKAHDKHIAYVSHLSHISAFMLGKTVINKEKHEQDIFDMAGQDLYRSSCQKFTRCGRPFLNRIKYR
jgi:prephenate dehydrogenase